MTTARLIALALAWGLAQPALAQDDPATPPPVPDAVAPEPPPIPEPVPEPPPLPEPEPTPPPLPDPVAYWIEENGAQGGPYTLAELEARVAAGTLTARTLAWTDGMADWAPASEVEDLAGLFAAAPVPAPDPAPAAFDPAAFVLGTWRQEGQTMLAGGATGFVDLTAEFRADGTYLAQGTLTATLPGQAQPTTVQMRAQGNYGVQPLGGERFSLTLSGTMEADVGFGPQTQPLAETTVYERVDANTIRDPATGEMLTRAGG